MNEYKSWKEAKLAGSIKYFTGKPCKKGHISPRFTSTRHCIECQAIRSLKYSRSEKGKLQYKNRHLKKTYGISLEKISACTNCQICKVFLDDGVGKNGRCVDHDHESGEIRGILCNNCNRALGLMQDDPKRLVEAAKYLYADKLIPEEWLNE